ncbi:hypothetical protein RRG08_058685 [Elysia crispata]|uniref:Sugar transporter SWEET n=1 Tax=Elysia crispata TaxID=231223 RepID=A0AAE1D6C5_9GAST|nr:hypothetical protein RRG08_058685 [Elysia crispata]
MDWVSTLSVLATVTSFATQFVGLEICFRIVQRGSSSDVSPTPFVIFFVSACVWLKYGLMMSISNVVLTSSLGAVLQFLYICVYYLYTTKRHSFHRLCVLGVGILFLPLCYVNYYEYQPDLATRNLGLYCCALSILCYASPLATVADVIKSQSTESISFPLCFMNFLCAVEWALYGIAINDQYVTFPNALGGLLGLIQFILFGLYGFKKRSRHKVVPVTQA